MDIKLNDFLAYLSCPRKYAHVNFDSQKDNLPPWLIKRKQLTDFTFAKKLPMYCEANAVNYRLAGSLKSVLNDVGITQRKWTVKWGKGGKYTITYDAYVDKDGCLVYIHSSSSPFSQFAKLKTILMILKKYKVKVLSQNTTKIKMKKTESWDEFAKRSLEGVRYTSLTIELTAQELEANKYWILQVMNKIQKGHFNQPNPTECVHTVEECEYRHICWGTTVPEEVVIENNIKANEPDKIIIRERELPFEGKIKSAKI